ncbi:DEAD/DEAH box helicase [Neolewinella lacunae]|uniref:DEAD/DEAH box helicase n=1 Tax=Neolewinella lacunae TaxID=1517758 RepID=A0A923PR33_9BACT|nr:DEAD/DEAH box helicase [Neolewinella lacunae]MBC6995913.1 DEAD/DEAH box helicase [Neolewinella lacunae]MDN3636394.1 DEAD/DEAH box helicase [Neolewinella lacunae]
MDTTPDHSPAEQEEEVVYFDELDISDDLLDALDDMGFDKCTPIQAKAIPPALEGRDILAVAQTGTGKTAAFLLPILDKLSREPVSKINTIILEPTRELAMQVDRQLEGFSYYMSASSIAIYGGRDGFSMGQEQTALKTGAAIVVATPGRLMAHLDLGYADLSEVRHLVLDEADRMLDMGFVNDMLKIIEMLPKENLQILFFSATMPAKIRKFSKEILKDPVEISIAISKPAEKIDQKAYDVADWAKIALIEDILREKTKTMERILIFCGRKKTVRDLTRRLQKRNDKVMDISSDLEQDVREQRLLDFRTGKIQVVVATDVLSRGIHIDGIDLVINFDVPGDAEDYVHRIGRTARASAEGEAITLISREDRQRFVRIEQLVGKKVNRVELPERFREPEGESRERRGGNDARRKEGRGRSRGGNNQSRPRRDGAPSTEQRSRPQDPANRNDEPRPDRPPRNDEPRPERPPREGDAPGGQRKQRSGRNRGRGRSRGPKPGGESNSTPE